MPTNPNLTFTTPSVGAAGPGYATNINTALQQLQDCATLDSAGETFSATKTVTATFTFQGSASSSIVFQAQVAADTTPRLTIGADGKLSWGPGNSSTDISLTRDVVGANKALKISAGGLRIGNTSDGNAGGMEVVGANGTQWFGSVGSQTWNMYLNTAVMQWDRNESTTQTAMAVLANGNAGLVLYRVFIGATDSGGSGFRMLRIGN